MSSCLPTESVLQVVSHREFKRCGRHLYHLSARQNFSSPCYYSINHGAYGGTDSGSQNNNGVGDHRGRSRFNSACNNLGIQNETRRWSPNHHGQRLCSCSSGVLGSNKRDWSTARQSLRSGAGFKYYEIFSSCLDCVPINKWQTVSIYSRIKHEMAEWAIESVMGSGILKASPDFIDGLWPTDRATSNLVSGMPRWLEPVPYKN
jgi:hypothetical protein